MSSTAKMPIAMPQSVSTRSTCSGVAPSSTRNCASYMYGNIIRLPTNPGPLRTTTPTLLSRFANANAVASTSSRCRVAAHDFEQPHDVRRAEEVQADDRLPAASVAEAISSMSSVEVLVARTQPGLAHAIELGEDLLLQRHVFEHRLDDQVRRLEAVVAELRLNQREPLAPPAPP